MFNREYQRRAARQCLEALGIGLVHDPTSGFYRPTVVTPPTARAAQARLHKRQCGRRRQLIESQQLTFDFEAAQTLRAQLADRPLADIFPEAYADC